MNKVGQAQADSAPKDHAQTDRIPADSAPMDHAQTDRMPADSAPMDPMSAGRMLPDPVFRRRITLFQLLSFASFASMNYYTVLLKNIGFSATQIGFWGSVSSIIAVLTLPVWGILSDKIGSAKKLYLLAMILYAAFFAAMPAAGAAAAFNPAPIFLMILGYSLVRQPTHSLQDAWVIDVTESHGINYTSSRKWGSFGFALVSIFFGIATPYIGIPLTFYAAAVFIIPLVVLCRYIRPADKPPQSAVAQSIDIKPNKTKIRPWLLLRNYRLMTAFLMTLSLGFYSAMVTPFYPYILESAGMQANQFGTVSGYGAFVQVVCMWLISRYCSGVPLTIILIAGGLAGVLENVVYGLASNAWMMMLAGTLWGISMGINVSALPTYINSLVPRTHAATAMALNGTMVMLLTIAGNYSGGLLITSIGIDSYNYVLAAVRGALTLLFALSLLTGRKLNTKE